MINLLGGSELPSIQESTWLSDSVRQCQLCSVMSWWQGLASVQGLCDQSLELIHRPTRLWDRQKSQSTSFH